MLVGRIGSGTDGRRSRNTPSYIEDVLTNILFYYFHFYSGISIKNLAMALNDIRPVVYLSYFPTAGSCPLVRS